MRTLVVSDLHIGARSGRDVLRRTAPVQALLDALEGIERLVLLGDVLELFEVDGDEALAAARPLLEGVRDAMADREVLIVPGNHDRALLGRWLGSARKAPMALEHAVPADASPTLLALATALRPARVRAYYPGVWLRSGLYATHGHYLDAHLRFSRRLERLFPGLREWVGPLPSGPLGPEAYERVLEEPYARIAAYRRRPHTDRPGRLTRLARTGAAGVLRAVVPLMALAGQPDGLAPLSAGLFGFELRRAGLEAIATSVERLGVEADDVIFGHIHRAGPFAGEAAWTAGGTRYWNSGSWVFNPSLLVGATARSPYWPGHVIEVGAGGPPEVRRLLPHLGRAELLPPPAVVT